MYASNDQKSNNHPGASPAPAETGAGNPLQEEYRRWQTLFQAQKAGTRRFLEMQGSTLGTALIQPASQARFSLPEWVIVHAGDTVENPVPEEQREQLIGGLMDRLTRTGLNIALRQRLEELEGSSQPAVATAAGLLRHATAMALVHDLLPSGRTVRYEAAEGEEIPSIPASDEEQVQSAITAATDAIAEDGDGDHGEERRGELLVPYVPYARRFFLPQWVAFDDQDHLLVNTTAQAEAHVASMQRYVRVLHLAVALAPYILADEDYQNKRYGMLGQLVNQGRSLARYQTGEIIATIKRRAATNDLNRGLSLSLPYFDDQALEMRSHDFDVIPAGRIMFVPGFVTLAAEREQAKVEQDTRLDRATRRHLLNELRMLETAFLPSDEEQAAS